MFTWMENREEKWENGVGVGLDRGKDGGWDRVRISRNLTNPSLTDPHRPPPKIYTLSPTLTRKNAQKKSMFVLEG